jgi:hypothetical protein
VRHGCRKADDVKQGPTADGDDVGVATKHRLLHDSQYIEHVAPLVFDTLASRQREHGRHQPQDVFMTPAILFDVRGQVGMPFEQPVIDDDGDLCGQVVCLLRDGVAEARV